MSGIFCSDSDNIGPISTKARIRLMSAGIRPTCARNRSDLARNRPGFRPGVVQPWPRAGQTRPESFGRNLGPESPNFDPASANFGPMSAKLGPVLAKFGPCSANNVPSSSKVPDFNPIWTDFGFGTGRPGFGPDTNKLGPVWTKVGPKLTKFERCWPSVAQFRLILAGPRERLRRPHRRLCRPNGRLRPIPRASPAPPSCLASQAP